MNFLPAFFAVCAFFTALVSASELTVGRNPFVKIEGLVKATHLNGSYAMITGTLNEKGRYPVLAFLESKISSCDLSEDISPKNFFTEVAVKSDNAKSFRWNLPEPHEPSLDMTETHFKDFKVASTLLWKICDGDLSLLLDDGKVESMARVLGVWINQKYGIQGMMAVAYFDGDRGMTATLGRVWHGIGAWNS